MAERKRRTKEELLEEVQGLIQKENERHEAAIKRLQERAEELKTPKMSVAQKRKAVNDAIKQASLTPEEIAKKLGLKVEF